MTLIARNHRADLGGGDTRPQLFRCDRDGVREDWVLKLMGRANAELAADWIGSSLAGALGLRCPDVDIAIVPEDAIATLPADVRSWARPGPAFASRFLGRVTSGLVDPDISHHPRDVLGGVYALDLWLEVLDRRRPDGTWNLLEDLTDGSLWVMDFGKSLTPCLHVMFGAADAVTPPAISGAILSAFALSGALDVCTMIENMSEETIATTVAAVPSEWLDGGVRQRIVRFLQTRAGQVRAACERTLGGGTPS